MKKFILSFLFLASFFVLNAQELQENEKTPQAIHTNTNGLTFSLNEKAETEVPRLIVGRETIFDCLGGLYKLSDNTKISYSELNVLLKANADKIFIKKVNIYSGIFCLFTAGMTASYLVNSYAYSKDWEDMTFNSAVSFGACLIGALWTSFLTTRNQQLAIDSYNLNVLGLNQKK